MKQTRKDHTYKGITLRFRIYRWDYQYKGKTLKASSSEWIAITTDVPAARVMAPFKTLAMAKRWIDSVEANAPEMLKVSTL